MIKDFELIPSVVAAAGSKMDDGELLFTFPGVLEAIRAGTDLPPKSVHGRIRQVDSMAPPKSAAGAVKNLGTDGTFPVFISNNVDVPHISHE